MFTIKLISICAIGALAGAGIYYVFGDHTATYYLCGSVGLNIGLLTRPFSRG